MRRRDRFFIAVAVILLTSITLRAQTTAATDQEPASLGGIVTDSITGAPLAHAHVQLENPAGQQSRRYGAISLPDGRFSIRLLPPGTYQLTVEHRGYSLPSKEAEERTIDVKAGEKVNDLVLRMVPDAVISGRVVDANGVPMEQVQVEATGVERRGSANTDDRGEFRIGGLPQGRYFVRAYSLWQMPPEIRTDGTRETNYGLTYYPSSRTTKTAAVVSAIAGRETPDIEIKMLAAPILHLSGTISNVPAGTRGAFVSLVADVDQRVYSGYGADFAFTIWRVPPGHYQLIARSSDRTTNKLWSGVPQEINLTTTSIEGINLVLSEPFDLNGRLEIEGDDQIGNPEAHIPVIRFQAVDLNGQGARARITQSDGSFKITGLYPGRYHVLLPERTPNLPERTSNLYVKSVNLQGAKFNDGILDLQTADPKSPLTVLVGIDGAEITGIVRDSKGPVAASVALFFDDQFGFELAANTTARPDGSYAIRGVAPGKYKILAYEAKTELEEWSSDALALFGDVTEKIEASAGDKITQDLKVIR